MTDAYLRTVNASVRVDVSDTKVEGPQVRISPKGKKTFALRARAPSQPLQRVTEGAMRRKTLLQAGS